jgi:hypothetical protein
MATTTGYIVGKDYEVEVDSQPLQGSTNMVALRPAMDTAEFAAFGDDWIHQAAVVKRWDGSIRCIYSETASEAADTLWDAYDGMVAVAAEFSPKGTATGSNWQWRGSIIVTGVPIEIDRTGGIVTSECPFVGTGTLTKGTVA